MLLAACVIYNYRFCAHIWDYSRLVAAQDTSYLTFLLHWLFPEYEQRTLYGAIVVTV